MGVPMTTERSSITGQTFGQRFRQSVRLGRRGDRDLRTTGGDRLGRV